MPNKLVFIYSILDLFSLASVYFFNNLESPPATETGRRDTPQATVVIVRNRTLK